MAWHIIHSLLEMVRAHSTFPGKLWIILMFVFRIVVVARIGDNVYHDEQDQFFCNTRTPGCNNVCFNEFSPISQLRFWSLMVLTVSAPGIMFVIYATHKIYHASIKFPHTDDDNNNECDVTGTEAHHAKSWEDHTMVGSAGSYIHPPSVKRKRVLPPGPPSYRLPSSHISAPTICVIKRRRSAEIGGGGRTTRGDSEVKRRNKRRQLRGLPDNMEEYERKSCKELLGAGDNYVYETGMKYAGGYPIYEDVHGRKTEFVKKPKDVQEEMKRNKANNRMLENPTLFRAYWWHVVLRSILEGGFLYLQYYLYGMEVAEFYVCSRAPCTQPTDCFISRPTEKTILLRLMFVLGSIASALSVAEFYALGWRRFKDSVCCGKSHDLSHDQKRILLARLNQHSNNSKPVQARNDVMYVPTGGGLRTDALSLDSASSDTTIESV